MKIALAAAFAITFVLLARAALPQNQAEFPDNEDVVARFNREINNRKRSVASPSYGLMLFHGRVRPVQSPNFTSGMDEEGIMLQGVDLRFFIGKNATKNGFYSGIESGIFTYIPSIFSDSSSFTDTVVVDDPGYTTWTGTYDAKVKVDGAFAFLMGKYGLRFDTGSPLYGFSFGAEIGMGLGIRSGGVSIYVGDRQDPTADADLGGGNGASLLFDTALEASLRMGTNFRLFGKLGLVFLPIKDTVTDPSKIEQSVVTDTTVNSNEDYMRYALQNYIVEIDSFAYELRVGFALSFN